MNRRSTTLAALAALAGSPLARAQELAPPTPDPAPAVQPPQPQPSVELPPEPQASSIDPDTLAKFQRTVDAYTNAKSLRFTSRVRHAGFFEGKSPASDTIVRMARSAENPSAWTVRITGESFFKPDDPRTPVDVLMSPSSVAWLDATIEKLMERPVSQGKGPAVRAAAEAVPKQISGRTPFSAELLGESITVEPTDAVNGVPCELLTVQLKNHRGTVKLWINPDDALIRKIETASEMSAYSRSTVVEMSDVKVNEDISEASLAIELPDGFTKDSTVQARPIAAGATPASPALVPGVRPEPGPTPTTPPQPRPAPTESPAADATPPAVPAAPADREPTPLPPFEMTASDGSVITLQSLNGQVTVLWFWGSWSLAGQACEPVIHAARESFKDYPVRVVSCAVREKVKENAAAFLTKSGRAPRYVHVPDAAAAASVLAVRVYPTLIVVDAQGREVRRLEGFRKGSTPAELDASLRRALGLPDETPPEKNAAGTTAESPR